MAKRKKIPLGVQLAACMAELQSLRGDAIPYAHLKLMSAEQYLSLYQVDHEVLHCWTQNDHFANLTFRLIPAHRAKTKRDRKIIAKVNKAAKKRAAALVPIEVRGERADRLSRSKAAMAGNRNSPWKRKLSGKVERRA